MNRKDLIFALGFVCVVLLTLIGGDIWGLFRIRMLIDIPTLIIVTFLTFVLLINLVATRFLFPLQDTLQKIFIYSTVFFALGTSIIAILFGHSLLTWFGIAVVFLVSSLLINDFAHRADIETESFEIPKNFFLPIYAIIGILFLATRLYILITYQGSYLDEYLHIFTGVSWVNQAFGEIYKGIEYYRGIYLTALSAVSFLIFDFSFYAQKGIPLLFSIINFILFISFSKKYITNKWMHILSICAYAITPILIFNATYMRTYIFFETFAYISFFLVNRTIRYYEEKNWQMLSAFAVSTVIFIAFIFFTRDVESMLFLLIIAFGGLFYILFTAATQIKFDFLAKLPLKHWHILAIILLALPFLNVTKYLDLFLNGQLTHGDGGVQKFLQFFFVDNLLITVYFLVLWIVTLFEKNIERKIFFAVIASLFIFHNIITPDYRTLRGIFYFFPFFIIGAFTVIEKLYSSRFILMVCIGIVLAVSPLFSARQYFINGPGIPKEIDYYPFKKYYETVKFECKDRKILSMMHSNYISNFHGVKPYAIIYLRQEQLAIDERYYKGDTGNYFQSVDNVPVLSSYIDVENLLKNEKVCLLLTTDFRHTGLYITGNDYSALFGNLTTTPVQSLRILKN